MGSTEGPLGSPSSGLTVFLLPSSPEFFLEGGMAKLASYHKADVKFGTSGPWKLSYVVLCQSPALQWP